MLQEFRKWRRQLGTLVLAFFTFPLLSISFSADTSFSGSYLPWSGRTITGITSLTATTLGGTTANITTLNLTNDLSVANGGTGASTAGDARTNLGLVIGTDVQAQDDNLDDIAGFSASPADSNIIVGNGSAFVLESGATARTSLGVAIGTNVQAQDDELDAIAGTTSAADKLPYFTGSGTAATLDSTSFTRSFIDDANEATLKATLNMEAGTDFQGYDATLDDFAGLSPTAGRLIFGDGSNFTLQTTAEAKTHLGLVIGTDVQAQDDELDDLAGLSPTDSNFVVGNGSAFVLESGATVRTSLGLSIGSDVQAYHEELANIVGLTMTDSTFAVGNGSDIVMEDAATARTSMGLGTISTMAANNIIVTGGTVAGVAITNSSFSGTVNQSALVKTGSYTASAGEIVGVVSTGGAFRVTFPTNPTAGDMIRITDLGLALETNAVVLDAGEATDHMNGTTQSLSLDWNGLDLRCIATSVSAWSCSGT